MSALGDSAGPSTLGDLLYGGGEEIAAGEDEWIALVRAVAGGDQLALHDLYGRTHRLVFTLAIRIAVDRELAEEITVDAFHQVWRRAADFDPAHGSVLGWIMNVARSTAMDRVRARRDCSERPENRTHDERGGEAALRGALHTLTPDEREAIEVAFFSEMTYAETAARLGQPIGPIKTSIRSGLSKLRAALKERP